MNPDFSDQARRLQEIRGLAGQSLQRANLNPESNGGAFQNSSSNGNAAYPHQPRWADSQPVNDPLIYQGVYAPSGYDMLDILLQVYKRPNPQIQIGNVDSAVALVLCDAETHDHPIVYCSDPFQKLTGYSSAEVIGKNCRFLQHPPGQHCSDRSINQDNEAAKTEVKTNMSKGRESRVRFTNFRRDGSKFTNILTLVPISWEGKKYIVGFQADEESMYR